MNHQSLVMQKEITLHNRTITYTLRRSKRARSMRLTVHVDGSIVVTAPYGVGEERINRFLEEKSTWLISKIEYFKQFKGQTFLKHSRSEYLKLREAAFTLAKERVEHFCKTYRLKYKSISIKNQKTRWGSCSRYGNLNFNYKIIHLPEHLADYIIVHEICHLGELNHSQRFWNLVAKTFPDHQALRRELRKYPMALR